MKISEFLQKLKQNKVKAGWSAVICAAIIYYMKKYHSQFLKDVLSNNELDFDKHSDSRKVNFSLLTSSTSLVWLLSVIIDDVSIIDSFWSLGFGISSIVYYKTTAVPPHYLRDKQMNEQKRSYSVYEKMLDLLFNRQKRVVLFSVLWALRLSFYLTWRNFNLPEDYRYASMRRKVGGKFWLTSYFTVFLLQTILCFVISQPLRTIQTTIFPTKVTFYDVIGSLLWIVGFLFESIGDYQLAKFKSNPLNRSKVMNEGLWKYSRHPNYFGNACMFWGIWVMSCAVRNGWKHIYSPIMMNYLLLKISGVPLLESSLSKRKPQYEHYVRTTSSFIPWFPTS